MDKYYLNLITNEVKNFRKLKKQYGYSDIDDLIGHYIEEGVITSRRELVNVLKTLKKQLGILVKEETFADWWVNNEKCTIWM